MSDEITVEVNNSTLLVEIGAIPVSTGGATLGPDLTAIEALTGTGAPERIAADTWALLPTWQTQKLAADVSDTTGALVDSGLAFTPEANKTYLVEAWLPCRSAASTTGFQWSFVAPGGATVSAQAIMSPATINSQTLRMGQLGVAVQGATMTSADALARGSAMLVMGASPSGQMKVQFNTEVAASQVTILAGATLLWREVP